MVTTPPDRLDPAQRAPHFGRPIRPILRCCFLPGGTPNFTATFYRQRSTGIEMVTDSTYPPLSPRRSAGDATLGENYTTTSMRVSSRSGWWRAMPGGWHIYQGRLLHSGIIPQPMTSVPIRAAGSDLNLFVRERDDAYQPSAHRLPGLRRRCRAQAPSTPTADLCQSDRHRLSLQFRTADERGASRTAPVRTRR